ncbi:MAG: prepilin-type N-terminal cleavage/methylation domain-containing protein, partial [Gammaproteobacteria bacterium]|nr:prepilin-type N-terminal cleavage/methylation domain-containing protein [Gammaproteobacteria bacterium]
MSKQQARKRTEVGFTLIEVLVGIVVFALGMMALAALQSNLAKNSADANARTVAVNIGEEVIEAVRSFGQITSDGGTNSAYNDIVDGSRTINRGGNYYNVASDVTDYYYDAVNETFSTTAPAGAARSDMKLLEITVTWNANREFHVDQSGTTSGRLGSGSITLREAISSITAPSGGKVAISKEGNGSYAPPVDYNPGQNPDIISIQLGDNKFKESTTPLPDVIRSDELVETRFDVVTYSQDNSGATFLRREEFRAVSCECTLRVPSTDDQGGFRPTVWNGNEYSQAESVSKPYGVSANNQQSEFCDLCCRDHHDGGVGSEDDAGDPGRSKFNPFRPSTDYHDGGSLDGDHKHYNRDNNGNLVLASNDGDRYVEACRMVRKDGFFRIAQDLRQEGLNAFPADYLDESGEVSEYSGYVTAAVSAYEAAMGATDGYESSPPSLTAPSAMTPAMSFPASTVPTATEMEDGGTAEQQLRSRGIYIDYMSDELRTRINCLDLGGDGDACDVPDVTTALEIIPFYDVQLTWLARWNETPSNNPIDVTNEAVQDSNAHSRGIAALTSGFGYSTINSAVHTG